MGKINPSNPTLLKQIKGLNFIFFFFYTASLFTLMTFTILSFVIYSSTVIPNKKPDSVLLVDIQKTCVSTEILADKHTHISTSREWLLSSSCACLSFPRGHGGEGWGVGGEGWASPCHQLCGFMGFKGSGSNLPFFSSYFFVLILEPLQLKHQLMRSQENGAAG